jgi:hypothetical protein
MASESVENYLKVGQYRCYSICYSTAADSSGCSGLPVNARR